MLIYFCGGPSGGSTANVPDKTTTVSIGYLNAKTPDAYYDKQPETVDGNQLFMFREANPVAYNTAATNIMDRITGLQTDIPDQGYTHRLTVLQPAKNGEPHSK